MEPSRPPFWLTSSSLDCSSTDSSPNFRCCRRSAFAVELSLRPESTHCAVACLRVSKPAKESQDRFPRAVPISSSQGTEAQCHAGNNEIVKRVVRDDSKHCEERRYKKHRGKARPTPPAASHDVAHYCVGLQLRFSSSSSASQSVLGDLSHNSFATAKSRSLRAAVPA